MQQKRTVAFNFDKLSDRKNDKTIVVCMKSSPKQLYRWQSIRALERGAVLGHEHYPRLTFYGLVHNMDHLYRPKKRYFAALATRGRCARWLQLVALPDHA